MHVLVAGATGHLGRELVAELRRRGHRVRALVRDPSRAPDADEVVVADVATDPLDDACRGVEAVFSVFGGTSRFGSGPRTAFAETDTKPNLRLLDAAQRAGTERFAYVTLFAAERMRGNPYVDAHEEVVDALRGAPIAHTIVRANGFFSIYDELLEAVRDGKYRLIGDPDRRHNPVHDADLAVACAEALERGDEEVEVGGPETLTRRREAELAYEALGRDPSKMKRVPSALVRGLGALMRPRDPRRAAIADLNVRVCSIDVVAPPHGERRLGDYLAERATSLRVRE